MSRSKAKAAFNRTCEGRGYDIEASELMLDRAFRHLNLHRIQLRVVDFNERAKHMYEKLGFAGEGVQRETRLFDGKRQDAVRMGMLEEELSFSLSET